MKPFAKLAALLCAAAIALTAAVGLAACSHDNHEADDIARLFREGYECTMSQFGDRSWEGLFQKDDSYFVVKARMTKAQEEALGNLDFFADDYDEQLRALMETFTVNSCEDVSGELPTQEDLDKYVTKTLDTIEKSGLLRCGSGFNGEQLMADYTDGIRIYSFVLQGTYTEAEAEAMLADETAWGDLRVASASFDRFDWDILK